MAKVSTYVLWGHSVITRVDCGVEHEDAFVTHGKVVQRGILDPIRGISFDDRVKRVACDVDRKHDEYMAALARAESVQESLQRKVDENRCD